MLAALSQADTITWLSILLKVLAYATSLNAIGSVCVLALLRGLSAEGRAVLRRTALLSALAAGCFTALRLPVQASFLLGGTWDAAFDPMMLDLVATGPLGRSAALRLLGLALICGAIWQTGLRLALIGALLASASFAMRGHVLGGNHVILGTLLTVHILCLSFWIGAFAPIARAAHREPPEQVGALAQSFGTYALWAVGLAVAAGGLMLALLGVAGPTALLEPYAQMLALKLVLFAIVLALAARNKLQLTPALLSGAPRAGARLRRSIGIEAGVVAFILFVTASLTTLFAPP